MLKHYELRIPLLSSMAIHTLLVLWTVRKVQLHLETCIEEWKRDEFNKYVDNHKKTQTNPQKTIE